MFIFLIIFLFFIWIFLSFLWYIMPHKLLNVSYESNFNLKKLNNPHLIIASHYYNTVDAMVMCNESKKTKKTINIIAEFEYNMNQFWKSLPIYTSYRRINLYKGQKNNLVKRSIEYLNKDEHILMFLKKQSNSKGIYHILKEKKVPILFVKIYRKDQDLKLERKNNDRIKGIYGKKFNVDYNIIKDYNIDNMKEEEFMEWIKNNIYD